MDHQSVGLIARKLEETGLPTIYLGSCRYMMAQVKPPRGAFLNFPPGHQCGKPHDARLQNQILKDALNVLATSSQPGGIVDLPYEWDTAFDFSDFMKSLEQMLNQEGDTPPEWQPQRYGEV